MKYIIMAGGIYTEFPRSKTLTEICGEPLLSRTIRLLKDNNTEDIYVSTNNEHVIKYCEDNNVSLIRTDTKWKIDVVNGNDVASRKDQWLDAYIKVDEPVCYLYGDVYYSEETMKKIVEADNVESYMFFVACPPFGKKYPSPWHEPLAVKVMDTKLFFNEVDEGKKLALTKKLWRGAYIWVEFLNNHFGYDLNSRNVTNFMTKDRYGKYVFTPVCGDYSCDIDHPSEVKEYEKLLRGE